MSTWQDIPILRSKEMKVLVKVPLVPIHSLASVEFWRARLNIREIHQTV